MATCASFDRKLECDWVKERYLIILPEDGLYLIRWVGAGMYPVRAEKCVNANTQSAHQLLPLDWICRQASHGRAAFCCRTGVLRLLEGNDDAALMQELPKRFPLAHGWAVPGGEGQESDLASETGSGQWVRNWTAFFAEQRSVHVL